MKSILLKSPEYYFIILAILAGYSPPFYINPIFIGIVGILVLQIFFKNRISGLTFGIIFFLINLYFLGAVISEFSEFNEFNSKAKQLIFVGSGIWTLNLFFVLIMIYKYLNGSSKRNLELKTE
ncbi:hypothetical protein [uncultured Algibacter sp.]|uniref:hypothetical protein n=1 Tax=uncultured Algibacter sp. TaxID=298659 RepID=UPI0026049143|nr:hypothetical protein [uncultured Algibacter sp.]